MHPTVTSSHNDLRSGLPRQVARLPILLPLLLICVFLSTASAQTNVQTTSSNPTKPVVEKSDAQKAFEKMKTMSASWQGTIMDIPINVTIRAASSGTAILHEANTDGKRPPAHEITMFYVEENRLLAMHYCDGGNRARLEGKMSPDGKTIEFSFLDVTGSTKGGLVKRMAFTMMDENKHIVDLTFIMPNGTPVELRGEFVRTN